MDAKLLLLKETFESEFSMERFERWTKEFFNKVQIVAPYKKNINYLSEFAFQIESHSHVADFTDSEKNKIAVLSVELKRGRSIERARRVYLCMQARGFKGEVPALNEERFCLSDFYFLSSIASFCLAARILPVTRWIGFSIQEVFHL